jgi:hypothetical protein
LTHDGVFVVAPEAPAHDIQPMARGSSFSFRNLLAGLAIVVACLGAPAFAQSTPEQCAVLADDGERLACYDALFGAAVEAAGEPIVVQSERMIPALPSGRGLATLTIACVSGAIDVSFSFAGQLVSNTSDIAPLTLQIDQNATSVRTLAANDANTALSFATPRETNAFLDSLAGGTNLKVRVTPVRQRSLTVDFRLPAVRDEIAALRAACR